MKKLYALFFLSLLLVPGFACTKNKSSAVATVNTTAITQDEVQRIIQTEVLKYDPLLINSDEFKKKMKEAALNRLIHEQILLDEAEKRNLTPSEEELQSSLKKFNLDSSKSKEQLKKLHLSKEHIRHDEIKRIKLQKLSELVLDELDPISENEIESYYEKNKTALTTPEQYLVSQILFDTKETADEVHTKLTQGENFGKMAKHFSQSPDASRGGDLGWINISNAPNEFIDICKNLKQGELSSVEKTPYGYQIFKLREKKDAHLQSLSQLTPRIKYEIRLNHSEDKLSSWMETLKANATISINEKVLTEMNPYDKTN
ncbi:MAG: hypothetical protein COX62_07235 [Deltaproteobacteria bacterium CG_4_10_14_0_2_um_filter_43_8]|nr:MAG: hypothetical protein COV43_08905 [Deltaproteobacteria bacterium CG11_big_fil_rev_8_21_14_0_20_42_23]PJA19093.1 MAG: hypothetical protein COX62_07235 [Deltaproteobacteria bacterium CG_4_10_14_0_2_um_filter_43_8]PJC64937.1 MAG: hypothetical protein CO021_01790 [Deltaproteobacteria bacterium CG_4_9_14_0_2_um_filter_42_21]